MVTQQESKPLITVQRSSVHGSGVFAARPIRKGTRIIEYTGERVTHAQADSRYEDEGRQRQSHVSVHRRSQKTVIDAGVDGNDARLINHSCDPNCESVIQGRRVFIEAIRNIAAGEELAYDYQIQRDADDPADIDEIFACRCGSKTCRGTMLWPAEALGAQEGSRAAPCGIRGQTVRRARCVSARER